MGTASIPTFLRGKLEETYDANTVERIERGYVLAGSRPVTLRANTLKATAEEVSDALRLAGIEHERIPWYPDAFCIRSVRERAIWDLDIYREGKVYLQSLSSMLPPLILKPQAGADVLDMCAAPGGKTSQLAALADGCANLCACELNPIRAEKLTYNLEKLGVRRANVMRTDARKLDPFFSFDQILLDAPCTGSGTVRSDDPRVEKRLTKKLLDKVLRSQRSLLDRGLDVLKPDGTLVYSTCSIFEEENGAQVARALERHRDCELVPIALPAVGAFSPSLLPGSVDGTLTIAPSEHFEGFYLAAIKKKGPKNRAR